MAVVITSIGTRSAENVNITSVSGSGPSYTVTLSGAPSSGTVIGDTLTDEASSAESYLISGISGADLTVLDLFGASAAPSDAGSTQATTKRTHATITLWESLLDNTDLYDSSDEAFGELYDDTDFGDTAMTFDGGGDVGLAKMTLSVAAGERHDGTADSGARLLATATISSFLTVAAFEPNYFLEWIDFDCATNAVVAAVRMNATPMGMARCLIHESTEPTSFTQLFRNDNRATGTDIFVNNIIYSATSTGTNSVRGMLFQQITDQVIWVVNNTIHNINSDSGSSIGEQDDDLTGMTIQNMLITDVGTECFGGGGHTNATVDHNAASDATTEGTGSIDDITTADQYVSTVAGTEDLHLKAGSAVDDEGVDKEQTPAQVNIDINGRDRHAEGDTWSIGAHQFVAAAGGGPIARTFIFGHRSEDTCGPGNRGVSPQVIPII